MIAIISEIRTGRNGHSYSLVLPVFRHMRTDGDHVTKPPVLRRTVLALALKELTFPLEMRGALRKHRRSTLHLHGYFLLLTPLLMLHYCNVQASLSLENQVWRQQYHQCLSWKYMGHAEVPASGEFRSIADENKFTVQ